jgi:ATP phosphoribosyltransferase
VAATRRGRLPVGTPTAAKILRIAVPSKGRLRDPAIALLEDAGLGPETPGDRALAFPCRNAPVEALLVRADDIPEYVQDGVVDCGITGIDIVRGRGANVTELQRLGFGACTLEAAVPEESAFASPEDLTGARIATSFPRLAQDLLPVPITLVDVHGSVELAPRLGLADAIVDLVSTGSTLVMNGLRPIADVLSSEAILVANPTAQVARAAEIAAVDTMLSAVIAARDRKYLMMNAPATHLAELETLLPGLESPSVIPLAHAGMIAIHAVVGADDVWSLLPRLKAAGASGILVLPIEKIVP